MTWDVFASLRELDVHLHEAPAEIDDRQHAACQGRVDKKAASSCDQPNQSAAAAISLASPPPNSPAANSAKPKTNSRLRDQVPEHVIERHAGGDGGKRKRQRDQRVSQFGMR